MAIADLGPRTSDLGSRNAEHSLLAWAGWQMRIPSDWQPLKLTGTPQKGQMIVGDEECAVFIIKWEQSTKGRLTDGSQWVSGRLTRHGVVSDPNPPASDKFNACGWARDLQTQEGKETTYWYGYAEKSGLLLGITVNGVLPGDVRGVVIDKVLASLVTSPTDAESIWAMYDLSFTAPAGFKLFERHLYSGDVALLFKNENQETLLLRQVYPGELALRRRSLAGWFNSSPFKEHRRIRKSSMQLEEWQHSSRKALSGMARIGWKRVPFPLGWCSPRQTRSLGVHDQELNRLLLVEHMAVAKPHKRICEQAVESMNRMAGGNAGRIG